MEVGFDAPLPKEWATYHFYNSAIQAITQSLMNYPTLFSYFVAQAVLGTFVLLTFVELFSLEKSIVSYLKAGLFIFIGLTIFYVHALEPCNNWNSISFCGNSPGVGTF